MRLAREQFRELCDAHSVARTSDKERGYGNASVKADYHWPKRWYFRHFGAAFDAAFRHTGKQTTLSVLLCQINEVMTLLAMRRQIQD